MTVHEHEAGSELDLTDPLVVSDYAAHAIMIGGLVAGVPASPAVLLELDCYTSAELPTTLPPTHKVTLIVAMPGAGALIDAMQNSVVLLENLRRNQEGPSS